MQVNSIRWTKELASSEFAINPRTLTNRLRQKGIEPGPDNKYSTQQICDAVYGDIDCEKLRRAAAQATRDEIKAAREGKTVAEVAVMERAWESIAGLMKKRLLLIPSRVESQWRPNMTQREAKAMIETEVDEALSELAKKIEYFSPEADEEDAGESAGAAAPADD